MKILIQRIFIFTVMIVMLFLAQESQASISKNSTRISISTDILNVDGTKMGINPGDTVFIESGHRNHLRFYNIHGDSLHYVVFINRGGLVDIGPSTYNFGLQVYDCSFFKLTGTGYDKLKYGIKIGQTPVGSSGLSLDGSSSNFEIDHLEITKCGFAGICANPKPDCEDRLNRGNFVQRNTSYHDNYIHGTSGEAFYIGHSYYTGYTITCDSVQKKVYPHEIHGVRIYNNLVDSAGWDGIQVGCATEDCEIFGNKISYYGAQNEKNQNFGIILAAGTTGKCYNNFIINGTGNGINIFGLGNNLIFNNIIINPGYDFSGKYNTSNSIGIFCDDRATIEGRSFNFFNNTIISPKGDGIRFYSTKSKNNKVYNNIILNPGSIDNYTDKSKSYVCYDNTVDLTLSNNYFSTNTQSIQNILNVEDVYKYCLHLPIINNGIDVSEFNINTDFNGKARVFNSIIDIGAFEYDSVMIPSKKANSIKVFSNNTQGKLMIYSTKSEVIDNISIYELSGQSVLSQTPENNDVSIVNLKEHISKGIYLICVSTQTEYYRNKICVGY
ncbi:MAG: T9SS type A sorting domain-containing protein [Paludibacter sp.]